MESLARPEQPSPSHGDQQPFPGMIMLGAAATNAGKTCLAEALIRKALGRERGQVAGLKVTTVHEPGAPCPRGAKGCGVCESLEGPYRITCETGGLEGKDTTRMLAAGADPVYWLCARPSHLIPAVRELSSMIAPGTPVVCESNSLRQVVEPDLFVIVQRRGATSMKRSCREVLPYADMVVHFDGHNDSNPFDPEPDRIFSLLESGRWAARRAATAIVLAGGSSSRMGQDKALLPFQGKTLIEGVVGQLRPHFSQILVSAKDASSHDELGLEVVPDTVAGQGPLVGIASALARSGNELNFVVACDIPKISLSLLCELLRAAAAGAEVAVPITEDGHYEPLFAVYRKSLLPKLEKAIKEGGRRIVDFFGTCHVQPVPLGPGRSLQNINTENDYEQIGEPRG